MRNAVLYRATLVGSNLQNADLTNAAMYRVSLKDANIKGSKLRQRHHAKSNPPQHPLTPNTPHPPPPPRHAHWLIPRQTKDNLPCMTTGNSDFRRPADYPETFLNFADSIATNFQQQVEAQPEDQLKAPVGELFRASGQKLGLDISWRTEVRANDVHGRPDIGITRDQLLVGHIELKRPGMGAQPEYFKGANRQQWIRFKSLPNLIYTDGSEWSLYGSGELRQRVRITPDITAGQKAVDLPALSHAWGLLTEFLYWDPVVPGTSEGLAGFLAPLARDPSGRGAIGVGAGR